MKGPDEVLHDWLNFVARTFEYSYTHGGGLTLGETRGSKYSKSV